MAKRPKPIVLTILDGWGFSPQTKGNAIALARKPNYDNLLKTFPNTLIHTSGPFVGLPEGQMGNSEVGHLNMGAGRIIQMDITRIDQMIAKGEFFRHPLLLEAMKRGRGAPVASSGAGQRWRRAFTYRSSVRVAAHGSGEQSRAGVRPLLSWMDAIRRPTAASITCAS